MAVGPDEVRRMAELARLRLPAGEVETLARELTAILRQMDALQEVGGEPEQVAATGPAPCRPDVEGADTLVHRPEALAPEWRAGFFLVPRLASHDSPAPDGGEEVG